MNAGHMHILKQFARDTGPFRVNKQGATDLAAAIVAVFDLIEAASAHVGDDEGSSARRVRAALARIEGDA